MKNERTNRKFIGGSILAGSLIGLTGLQANAAELFTNDDLGSGSEVRADLVKSERTIQNSLELKCGEEGKASTETKTESKSSEAKCGEGKCGEGKCGGEE